MISRLGAFAAIAIAAGLLAYAAAPQAHKTVVSKFTYYEHVQPILAARCGRCHVEGGIAASLMTYQEASSFPWAIQQALLSRRMPPWGADEGLAPIKGHQALSPIELDTLMMWAAGGTPEGARPTAPIAAAPNGAWQIGAPDLALPMPQSVTLEAGRQTLEHHIVMPIAAGRWIRAVDLQPGAPSIVRRAEFSLRSSGAPDVVVGLWIAGDAPQVLEADAAFRIPANASLVAKVHYQRPPNVAGAVEDRSTIGVYFSRSKTPRPLQPMEIGDAADTPFGSSRVVSQRIDRNLLLVSVRPIGGPAGAMARIVIVGADGARTPVMRLQLRPDWPRRYALASPLQIARGSLVELTVTASEAAIWETLTGDRPADPGDGGPLRIALETVAR
jgi:hypothetical protein